MSAKKSSGISCLAPEQINFYLEKYRELFPAFYARLSESDVAAFMLIMKKLEVAATAFRDLTLTLDAETGKSENLSKSLGVMNFGIVCGYNIDYATPLIGFWNSRPEISTEELNAVYLNPTDEQKKEMEDSFEALVPDLEKIGEEADEKFGEDNTGNLTGPVGYSAGGYLNGYKNIFNKMFHDSLCPNCNAIHLAMRRVVKEIDAPEPSLLTRAAFASLKKFGVIYSHPIAGVNDEQKFPAEFYPGSTSFKEKTSEESLFDLFQKGNVTVVNLDSEDDEPIKEN